MRIINIGMKRVSIPSFVKWAGGKKQLLEQFNRFFPKKINRYIEPFVGGGAVLFFVLKEYKPKEVFIFDINEELIKTYEIIRDDVENLIKELKKLKSLHSKEVYYKIREEDPELLSKLTTASRFIYLNKTCFNGLYRVNSKGGFNVPIGSYKNPTIVNEEELREISKLLQNVKIKNASFEECLKYAKKEDFIYFDPPYYPLKKSSFTTYTKGNFLDKEQQQLKEVFSELDKKGCRVMLSNSDTKFIKDLYKRFKVSFVKASRMINCNGKDRGKISEVVITNYEPRNEQLKLS
jgi:DNA adenine methylase